MPTKTFNETIKTNYKLNKFNYTNFVVVDMALQTAVSLRRDCNHSAEEAVDNNMAVFVVGKGLGHTVD